MKKLKQGLEQNNITLQVNQSHSLAPQKLEFKYPIYLLYNFATEVGKVIDSCLY